MGPFSICLPYAELVEKLRSQQKSSHKADKKPRGNASSRRLPVSTQRHRVWLPSRQLDAMNQKKGAPVLLIGGPNRA